MGFMDDLLAEAQGLPEPEELEEKPKPPVVNSAKVKFKGVKAQFKNYNIYVNVEPRGKQYYYQLLIDDTVVSYQFHSKAPDECSRSMKFISDFSNKIMDNTQLQKDYVQDELMIMMNSLAHDLVTYIESTISRENEEREKHDVERLKELERVKDEFIALCESSGVTPIDVLNVLITYKANGENKNILTGILCHYSTYFKRKPLWFMAVGGSGEGKSFIEKASVSFVPDSAKMDGRMSENAVHRLSLDYSPSVLDGKILRMGDLGSKKDFERYEGVLNVYKQLSSNEKIEKTITSDSVNKETGERGVIKMHLEGECSVTFTTVHSETIDEQYASRGFIVEPVGTDDEVQNYTLHDDGDYKVEINEIEDEYIKRLVWGYVEYIHLKYKDARVYNPFQNCLYNWLKKHPNYFKRDLKKYKALVDVVTLLNFPWRNLKEVDGVVYLTSTIQDNQLIGSLFQPIFGLSPVAVKLFNKCVDWFFKQSTNDPTGIVASDVICDCTPEEYLEFTEKELDKYEANNLKMKDFVGVFTASSITKRLSRNKLKVTELGNVLYNLTKAGVIEDTGVKLNRSQKNIYRLSCFEPFTDELIEFDDDVIEDYVSKVAPRTFKKIDLWDFSKDDGQDFIMDYKELQDVKIGDLGVSAWF